MWRKQEVYCLMHQKHVCVLWSSNGQYPCTESWNWWCPDINVDCAHDPKFFPSHHPEGWSWMIPNLASATSCYGWIPPGQQFGPGILETILVSWNLTTAHHNLMLSIGKPKQNQVHEIIVWLVIYWLVLKSSGNEWWCPDLLGGLVSLLQAFVANHVMVVWQNGKHTGRILFKLSDSVLRGTHMNTVFEFTWAIPRQKSRPGIWLDSHPRATQMHAAHIHPTAP